MHKWKRPLIVGVILSLAIMLPFPSIAVAADATVSIDAPAEVGEGTDFIARVNITEVVNFDAANYDITYDPTIIEVTDVTDGVIGGTAIPVSIWGLIPSGVQGKIRVIQNIPGISGVSGSGYLAEIHFHVIGSAGSTSNITPSNAMLSDNTATEIPATWVGDSVHVNTALDAGFSASPLEGVAGVTGFTFTDATTGGTPSYTYEWDFDNNGTVDSTAANPTYIYASAGTYTVSLTVTDSLSTSNAEVRADYITVYQPVDAGFSASPLEGVAGVTGFTFTDATTGGTPPYNYEWDFDNNGTVDITAANPTYIYASAGTYTISLTVTDSLSTSNAEAKTDYITVYDPGDANKDGNVSSLDITKLERVIMGLDDPTPGADANADGSIDALDITQIELIIIGA